MNFEKRFIGTEIFGGHTNLRCPKCGDDDSHVRGAFTRIGSDESEAAVYEGTTVKGSTEERRSALVVVVDGECGHSWEIVFQQNKGITLLEIILVSPRAVRRQGY